MVRVTRSELLFLTVYLLKTQIDSLSPHSLAAIDHTIDQVFFKKGEDGVLDIFEMQISTNGYLLEAYKQTFLPDNLSQSLGKFFNERPVESCPTMYKLLLVILSSPNLSLENFKTLLSEVAEVLPCILRQESDLLTTTVFQQISSVRTAAAASVAEVNAEGLQRRSYI